MKNEIILTWIFENGMWCCPYCKGTGEPNYLYCPNCGRVIDGVQLWLTT